MTSTKPNDLTESFVHQRGWETDAIFVGKLSYRRKPHGAGEVQMQMRLRKCSQVSHNGSVASECQHRVGRLTWCRKPGRQSRSERALMRNEHTSLPFFAPIAAMMPRTLFMDWTRKIVRTRRSPESPIMTGSHAAWTAVIRWGVVDPHRCIRVAAAATAVTSL